MKSKAYWNLAATVAVVVLGALFSGFGRDVPTSPQKKAVADVRNPETDRLSVWGLKIGMSSKEAASILKIDKEETTGGFTYCSACDPRDWTGKYCLEHGGHAIQGAEESDQVSVGYWKGRINTLSSPVLELDGATVLRRYDPLSKVTSVFPSGRVQRQDDGRNIVILPGEQAFVQMHEDQITEFQFSSRGFRF